MSWYYAREGQQLGPMDDAALQELVRTGVVREDTLVWRDGMQGWQPYSSARFVAGTPTSMPPPAALPSRHYGGFWMRFLARLIDGILLGVVGWILFIPLALMFNFPSMIAMMEQVDNQDDPTVAFAAISGMMGFIAVSSLIQIAVAVFYEAYFLSTRGATPGKMALNLKVIRADGSGVSSGLAVGRYFASILSNLTLCIGYIIAGFDSEKRSLHDHICGTRVIYTK